MLRKPVLKIDRVGHAESIPDQRDSRAVIHDHLDHVEPVHDFGPVEHTQPLLGPGEQTLSFGRRHRGVRRAERVGTAGLYFDKNQGVRGPITANQVDFAAVPGSEIPVQDFEAMPAAQKPCRKLFSSASQPEVRRLLASTSKWPVSLSPQARKNGDESGRVHKRANVRGAPWSDNPGGGQIHNAEIADASLP